MRFPLFAFAFLLCFESIAQVKKAGYDQTNNLTLLFYSVKGIDTVKVPGNWERDKRDLATSVYLVGDEGQIGFYIDTKNKKYAAAPSEAGSLKFYVADKTKKLTRSGWEFELLETDGASYQLYKIKSPRHPDANQIGLYGARGRYVYNIVCYSQIGDSAKSQFLIDFFKKTTP